MTKNFLAACDWECLLQVHEIESPKEFTREMFEDFLDLGSLTEVFEEKEEKLEVYTRGLSKLFLGNLEKFVLDFVEDFLIQNYSKGSRVKKETIEILETYAPGALFSVYFKVDSLEKTALTWELAKKLLAEEYQRYQNYLTFTRMEGQNGKYR